MSELRYEWTRLELVATATFERLLELTNGAAGAMQGLAVRLRTRPNPDRHPDVGMVALAWLDDLVVGWTLVDYDLKAELFVAVEHRRQGIATNLLRTLIKVRGPTNGHTHMPYVRTIVARARAA